MEQVKILTGKKSVLIIALLIVLMIVMVYMDTLRYKMKNIKKSSFIDIHREDDLFWHVWPFKYNTGDIKLNSIAVGMGITSKGMKWKGDKDIATSLIFFTTLLPSFCKTARAGYDYNFYLAYDVDDAFYTVKDQLGKFNILFNEYVTKHCDTKSNYSIHFIQCSHRHSLAKAQNDAMMEAYMSNMQYYYRINDDTEMITPGWTEQFIDTLNGYNPPNVGVVGPNHTGGKTSILTFDFVHYTHLHIHGIYYPRNFIDIFGDNWITNVYQPDHYYKLKDVKLKHTMQLGRRYQTHRFTSTVLKSMYLQGMNNVNRYINLTRVNQGIKPRLDHVISLGISGTNRRYTYGAIRNAQLMPLYFPDWTLRVYVVNNQTENSTSTKGTKGNVPCSVMTKLKILGAQVMIINSTKLSSNLAKYIIMDDKSIKTFLIRYPEQRISLRDSMLVKHWLKDEKHSVFCAKIQSKALATKTIVPNLIGARNNKDFHKLLDGESIATLLQRDIRIYGNSEDKFLEKLLLPKLKGVLTHSKHIHIFIVLERRN